MIKIEIYFDYFIMIKIKSFKIKLKENLKIYSFKKNKKNFKCVNIFISVCFIFIYIINNDENINKNFIFKRIY